MISDSWPFSCCRRKTVVTTEPRILLCCLGNYIRHYDCHGLLWISEEEVTPEHYLLVSFHHRRGIRSRHCIFNFQVSPIILNFLLSMMLSLNLLYFIFLERILYSLLWLSQQSSLRLSPSSHSKQSLTSQLTVEFSLWQPSSSWSSAYWRPSWETHTQSYTWSMLALELSSLVFILCMILN